LTPPAARFVEQSSAQRPRDPQWKFARQGQVDDLLEQIRVRAEKNDACSSPRSQNAWPKTSANISPKLASLRYLHSEIETLDRIKILRDLRRGEFDVLIGINLLARSRLRKFRSSPFRCGQEGYLRRLLH